MKLTDKHLDRVLVSVLVGVVATLIFLILSNARGQHAPLTPGGVFTSSQVFESVGAAPVPCPANFGFKPSVRVACAVMLEGSVTRSTVDELETLLVSFNTELGFPVSRLEAQPDMRYAIMVGLPDGTALDFWLEPGYAYLWAVELVPPGGAPAS